LTSMFVGRVPANLRGLWISINEKRGIPVKYQHQSNTDTVWIK
jgi:hypothetical protein